MNGLTSTVTARPRLVVCLWLLIATVCYWGAPRIPTLLEDDRTHFLPKNMPSQEAAALLKQEFPDAAYASRLVVVFSHEHGLADIDRKVIKRASSALEEKSEAMDWRVRSASLWPFLAPLLESADGQVALIVVELPAGPLTHHSVKRARYVREIVQPLIKDTSLAVEFTGDAALGELLDEKAKHDVDRTTLWAFIAVACILLFVYRSPVAMLLPVVTVAMALLVSLGLIGRAAAWGLPINGLVEMFIVVILAGSGVDYCLFLFARFREHMAEGDDARCAVQACLQRIAPAILASAGTNAAAMCTLALASNRDLSTSGPTIAFAIVIVTVTVLTLTPAMMCLVGRYLVWPMRIEPTTHDSRLWSSVARIVTQRPGLVVLCTLMMIAPWCMVGMRVEPLFDAYEEYPADSSFVRGARRIEAHWYHGRPVAEQTLLVTLPESVDTIDRTGRLSSTMDSLAVYLTEHFPLAYMRDIYHPLGRRTSENVKTATLPSWLSIPKSLMRPYFVGASDRVLRLDIGLWGEPRSNETLDRIEPLRQGVRDVLSHALPRPNGPLPVEVHIAGSSADYVDNRMIRDRDFKVVAVVAVLVVALILYWLVHSIAQTVILVAATLITYLAAYGVTWWLAVNFLGVSSLSYQIDFLLFIVVLSLGQDYNIYVVTRVREELDRAHPQEAIRMAIIKTGQVVSSCGLIMAAAFGSMASGSLVLMKEFAIALALGILIDTFVIRPLLIPATLLLLERRNRAEA